jgi:NADH-quinone oxidoreductase subunit H
VLSVIFGANALALVLHVPLRAYLAPIYGLIFEYLLPFLAFFIKSMVIAFVILWLRWTLPRLRVDQLMGVCWKYLIPMGFICLLGQGIWMTLFN